MLFRSIAVQVPLARAQVLEVNVAWLWLVVLSRQAGLTSIPVRCDVAMTGEITLRGEVLAIGGLKEKLLAAVRGGLRKALIPQENVKDLAEIPDNIKNKLEIIPVKWIDQVFEHALERAPEALGEDVPVAARAAEAPPAQAVITH